MAGPLNGEHYAKLETNEFWLQEDGSKIILNEGSALDDPYDGESIATLTPGAIMYGEPVRYIFEEKFDNGTIDPTIWSNWGGGNVVATKGKVTMTSATAADSYFGMESLQGIYDLRGNSFSVRVGDAGNQSLASFGVFVQVFIDGTKKYEFAIENNTLVGRKNDNGSLTDVVTPIAYVSADMQYLRIREENGQIHFDYAGVYGEWVYLGSITNTWDVSRVFLSALVGNWDVEASTTSAWFSEFQFGPANMQYQIQIHDSNNFDLVRDDLHGLAVRSDIWDEFTAGGAKLFYTPAGAQVSIPASAAANTEGDLTYNQLFDFTGKSATVRVKSVNNITSFTDTTLTIRNEAYTDLVSIQVENGTFYAQKVVASVQTNLFTGAYDPNKHKWWRIKESLGTTFWQYSTDGLLWVTFWSAANPLDMTSVRVLIVSGTYQAEASSGNAIFDMFSISTNTDIDANSIYDYGWNSELTGFGDDYWTMENGDKITMENGDYVHVNRSYLPNSRIKYTVPAGLLAPGTYYWRARAMSVMPKIVPVTEYFYSNTTWTCPEGVGDITVEVWGGGGSGGGDNSGNTIGGAGGGGGAYSKKNHLSVTPGTKYTVHVGLGGTPVASGASNAGVAGGDSYFLDASTVMAKGGNGGAGAGGSGGTGGAAGSGVGDVKRSGGNGFYVVSTGAGGSAAGRGVDGNSATSATAAAAPGGLYAGAGGAGVPTGNGAGGAGGEVGGGGGGALGSGNSSGRGGNGLVVITYNKVVYEQVFHPWSNVQSFLINIANHATDFFLVM